MKHSFQCESIKKSNLALELFVCFARNIKIHLSVCILFPVIFFSFMCLGAGKITVCDDFILQISNV